MQAKDILDQLSPANTRIALEITLGLLSSLVVMCLTYLLQRSKHFFESMDSKLDTIQNNHLHTIQDNTGKTVKLLEKVVEGQNEANLRQTEMNAFLRAKFD